jgi:hypothetical protein
MTRSNSIPSDGRIVDTMIQLARAAKLHRMIVAGSNSPELFLELHRRGHLRVTTAKLCDVPCGQFDVALVAPFLSGAGVLVVWAGPYERMPNHTLRLAVEKLAFRIESATCCENGVAVCARRSVSGSTNRCLKRTEPRGESFFDPSCGSSHKSRFARLKRAELAERQSCSRGNSSTAEC